MQDSKTGEEMIGFMYLSRSAIKQDLVLKMTKKFSTAANQPARELLLCTISNKLTLPRL